MRTRTLMLILCLLAFVSVGTLDMLSPAWVDAKPKCKACR